MFGFPNSYKLISDVVGVVPQHLGWGTKKKSEASLSSLAPELIQEILNYCPPQSVIALSAVNRQLRGTVLIRYSIEEWQKAARVGRLLSGSYQVARIETKDSISSLQCYLDNGVVLSTRSTRKIELLFFDREVGYQFECGSHPNLLKYHPLYKMLFVAGQRIEGNEWIYQCEIFNLRDRKNVMVIQIDLDKRISQIVFQENRAYLFCHNQIHQMTLQQAESVDGWYVDYELFLQGRRESNFRNLFFSQDGSWVVQDFRHCLTFSNGKSVEIRDINNVHQVVLRDFVVVCNCEEVAAYSINTGEKMSKLPMQAPLVDVICSCEKTGRVFIAAEQDVIIWEPWSDSTATVKIGSKARDMHYISAIRLLIIASEQRVQCHSLDGTLLCQYQVSQDEVIFRMNVDLEREQLILFLNDAFFLGREHVTRLSWKLPFYHVTEANSATLVNIYGEWTFQVVQECQWIPNALQRFLSKIQI